MATKQNAFGLSAEEAKLLDIGQINSVLELGDDDPDFCVDIFTEFTSEYESNIAKFHDSLQGTDAKRVENTAHALKGISKNIGAKNLGDIWADFQKLASSNKLDEVKEKAKELDPAYEAVHPLLKKIFLHES